MIEIYFDGKLLDNSNYLAFSSNFQPFDKEFYLGSTGSITASLTIPKGALPSSLTQVDIKINNQNWYSCVVDAIEENDNEEYIITLTDKLINTEVGYDFSDKVPISAKTLLENICTDFNIPHDEFNFTNQDVTISSYDSTVTAREYLGMIAELAGGYITINQEGKLEIGYYGRESRNLLNPYTIEKSDYLEIERDGTILVSNCPTDNGYTSTNKKMSELCPSLKVGDVVYLYLETDFTNPNGSLKPIVYLGTQKYSWYRDTAITVTQETLDSILIVYGGYNKVSHLKIAITKDQLLTSYEKYPKAFTLLPDAPSITADEVDTFKIKNTVTVERVVWQFVANKMESSSDESLYTVYLDGNNLFLQNITREVFDNICNNIIGFTFSCIKIDTTNKFFNSKNIIKFIDRDNKEYNMLPFFEADYNGGLVGSYDSNIENAKQNETRVKSTSQRIKRIKQTVDQDSNILQIAVEDITYQKETTNPSLESSIQDNKTLIEQTANTIRQEVTETAGTLQNNIEGVQDNLDNVEEALDNRITTNTSNITILAESITNTVKSIGGNNLLRNSVGFAKTTNTRESHNKLDASTLIDGDIKGSNKGLRLITKQEVYLEPGNYTLSTDLGSAYQFSITIQNVGLAPLPDYPTYILNTSWHTAGTTVKTFNVTTAGWFNLWIKKTDNSSLTVEGVKSYIFQLVPGSTALPYEDYGLNIVDYETLDFWDTNDSRYITSQQDTDTESSTISGSKIVINNIGKMEQEYVTISGLVYGVSLKLKHIINGGTANNIKITIVEGEKITSVLTSEQQTRAYANFMQLSEFTYTATATNPKIVIETDGDDLIEISDLIISQGENQAWSSYFDEVYGKEHRLDKYGLKLTDVATGDYSQQTPKGLTFIDDNQMVSEFSRSQAKSDAGRFTNEISLRKLQWIVLDDDNVIEYIL